jgi:transglutaminase-like putative cysteine protease
MQLTRPALISPPMRLALIPDGVAGVAETLGAMSAFVRLYKKFPVIRTQALDLAGMPAMRLSRQQQWIAQIEAIFEFVRSNIAYVQDVTDVETLQTPMATLQMGGGDCDDMVTLLAALLEAVGFHTRLVACGFAPNEYEHVFLQVQLPDQSRWFSLDPTEPYEMGWKPPGIISVMTKDN